MSKIKSKSDNALSKKERFAAYSCEYHASPSAVNSTNVKGSNNKINLAVIAHNKKLFSCNWKSFKDNLLEQNTLDPNRKSFKNNELKQYTSGANKAAPLNVKKSKQKQFVVHNSVSNISDDKVVKNTRAVVNNKPRVPKLTRFVAMDCEMVGINDGKESMLARVSLVNKYGDCIYDKYVKPREPVIDYRTSVSGIRPKDLVNGEEFEKVQKEVADILDGRILVGHALSNDLKVLFLGHPRRRIRDTARYRPFRKLIKSGRPSLKKLALELLGVKIQEGEHDSVTDAKTAMQVYMLYRKEWERELHTKKQKIVNGRPKK